MNYLSFYLTELLFTLFICECLRIKNAVNYEFIITLYQKINQLLINDSIVIKENISTYIPIRKNFNPNISIIFPCYNKGEFLERSFKSLIDDQHMAKYKFNIEIICIDDGSTDNTFQIFHQFQVKYEGTNCNIKIFRFDENRGSFFAKRYAIQKAKADYVMFLDSDDEFIPDIIHRMLSLIKNRKDIDVIQFRMIKLKKREIIKPNNDSNYTYEVFTYGKYPFKIMNYIILNETISKSKYRINKENETNIDKIDHAKFINHEDLMKMCLKLRMMWNLPCLIMKKKIVIDGLNIIKFDFNLNRICVREDLLIAYSAYLFSRKVYFLDEIGYIYYKNAKKLRRAKHYDLIDKLINDIFKNESKKFVQSRIE